MARYKAVYMTETEALADLIALSIHAATEPLRLKIAALEALAQIPGPAGKDGRDGIDGKNGQDGLIGKDGRDGIDGKPGIDGLAGTDGRDGLNGKDGTDGIRGEAGFIGPIGPVGLPGRDGLPGVPGRQGEKGIDGIDGNHGMAGINGKDGKPGLDGKDGRDGLSFDDCTTFLDETKGWILRFAKGDRRVDLPLPIPWDAGIWQAGRNYPQGAGVTVKGAFWIAQTATKARPGDDTPESRAWRLSVKAGRDGKEGKEGRPGKDWEPGS